MAITHLQSENVGLLGQASTLRYHQSVICTIRRKRTAPAMNDENEGLHCKNPEHYFERVSLSLNNRLNEIEHPDKAIFFQSQSNNEEMFSETCGANIKLGTIGNVRAKGILH